MNATKSTTNGAAGRSAGVNVGAGLMREQMDRLRSRLDELAAKQERPLQFMEICGTHTVNACRAGLHSILPENVRMISGPGCPVCVTAQRVIDALVKLGNEQQATIATYGDMLRVNGEGGSLERARSEGAAVRVVTSAMEAVDLAEREPGRQVVFAAVGFETTAPASAAAVLAAEKRGLENFSILTAHKLVMPAMRALLADPEIAIDGFICPGHVSVIIGSEAYRPIVDEYGSPCVVVGFEALQIMQGIVRLTELRQSGTPALENLYPQVVRPDGNPHAMRLLDQVFEPCNEAWRALGEIGESGLGLRPEYARFDARTKFGIEYGEDHEPPGCRCGEVITGRVRPDECPLFVKVCTPLYPIGPCMVSSEGTCQAWFRYRRHETKQRERAERKPETAAAKGGES